MDVATASYPEKSFGNTVNPCTEIFQAVPLASPVSEKNKLLIQSESEPVSGPIYGFRNHRYATGIIRWNKDLDDSDEVCFDSGTPITLGEMASSRG